MTVTAIAQLPADTSFHHLNTLAENATWEQFRKLAVAAATRRHVCPPALHQVLDQPRFYTDRVDALALAEADLQVALLRRRYEHGPESREAESVRGTLRKVRLELARLRSNKPPKQTTPPADGGDGEGWALRRMNQNHRTEYETLVKELLRRENLPEALHATAALSQAEQIIMLNIPFPLLDPAQLRLLQSSDEDFRTAVSIDINKGGNSNTFDHPLFAQRWLAACQQLVTLTRDLLGTPETGGPHITESELFIPAGHTHAQAFERINRYRFLGNVYSALREARRAVTKTHETIADAYGTKISPLLREAYRTLRDRHPDEYQHLLDTRRNTTPATPNPQTGNPPPRATPHFAEQITELAHEYGWNITKTTRRNTVWLTAGRPGHQWPLLRVSYRTPDNTLRACTAQVEGEPKWFLLPNIAELKTLLTMDAETVTATVRTWRTHTPHRQQIPNYRHPRGDRLAGPIHVDFDRIGRAHPAPLTIENAKSPHDLADRILGYATQFLNSQDVAVHVDLTDPDNMTGFIQVGMVHIGGRFTLTAAPRTGRSAP